MENKIVYTPSDIKIELATHAPQRPVIEAMSTPKSDASMQPQRVLSQRAQVFKSSLGTDMMVKNITSKQIKHIDLAGKISTYNGKDLRSTLPNIRDDRVKPKANYSKIDETMVNIFGHKGPDEPREVKPL